MKFTIRRVADNHVMRSGLDSLPVAMNTANNWAMDNPGTRFMVESEDKAVTAVFEYPVMREYFVPMFAIVKAKAKDMAQAKEMALRSDVNWRYVDGNLPVLDCSIRGQGTPEGLEDAYPHMCDADAIRRAATRVVSEYRLCRGQVSEAVDSLSALIKET